MSGAMAKIIVYHSGYGCDTGCCGHFIEVDGKRQGQFEFFHPFQQDHLEWAKDLVRKELGEEHVTDLDWENCYVIED